VQTVKISFPAPGNSIERTLAQRKTAELYGIYFDTGSANLRPESRAVLDQIDSAMRAHLDWKVEIAGDTDNIGGDVDNRDLFKRRADAVKRELITKYGIAENRLSSNGYGASRPKDTNDTLSREGRRTGVELSRF
jgi:OOP family OmpA-OmpF porin